MLIFAAHAEGIAVGEVVGDVHGIGERNVRALFGKADVIAVVFEPVGEETGSGMFAAADNGEEHEFLRRGDEG